MPFFQIHLQRSTRTNKENISSLYNDRYETFPDDLPLVLKSKLLIVDLAGSERIDKSGKTSLHILSFYCELSWSLNIVTDVFIALYYLFSQEVKVT